MKHLRKRARDLGLHGLVGRWDDVAAADWLEDLICEEERTRNTRSYARRRAIARLPAFTPLADYDWTWPRTINRADVEGLMGLAFITRGNNAILVGGQGTGKTMIAANIAHQALLHGNTVRFERAAPLLEDLAEITTSAELRRRLTLLARPRLLVLDEIGYVTHEQRQADILYAIVSQRYARHATLITTSLGFAQWERIFPGAASIAGTIDRLTHNATLIPIDGTSWRTRRDTG